MKTKNLYFILLLPILLSIIYFILDGYQEVNNREDLIKTNDKLQFVNLSRGSTRVLLHKQEGNKILFLHGGGIAGSEIWRSNIEYMNNRQYDILAYDQYGKGFSIKPRMKYSLNNLSQQLNEILDSTNFDTQKLSIVSHSMGGMLAIKFLVEHPDKVDKIILLSPGLLGGFKPKPVLKVPIVADMLMTYYWYWGFLEGRRKEFYDEEKYNEYKALVLPFSKTEGFKYVYRRTWLDVLTEDVKQDLQKISEKDQKRIMIIFGMNDPYYNEGSIPALKKYLPYTRYITLDNVGHNVNFEKPDTVNQIIHNFIF